MLKRSAFARQRPERVRTYPSPIPEHLRRSARMDADIGIAVSAIPKDAAVRSEAYRRLVALMDCIHCGIAGYSQAAHADQGKGAHIKSDDRTCYPACAPRPGVIGCHALIGMTGSMPREDRRELEQRYAALTREAIETAGLWPANLPKVDHGI